MTRSYLRKDVVRKMLDVAVEPEIYFPVCPQWYATDAAGNAVAGLSARAIKHHLRSLYSKVDVRRGEIKCEKLFTREKLKEHTAYIEVLSVFFRRLTRDYRKNPVLRAFCDLQKPQVERCRKAIASAGQTLNHVVNSMETMATQPGKLTTDAVQHLLYEKVLPRLKSILEELAFAIGELTKVIKRVDGEWRKCVNSLKQPATCRVARETNGAPAGGVR
ncbi:MAG: hypothetical protein ACYS74_06980 [Planctomycetota bacterium]|jgi:hypothetical protein